MSNSKRIVFLSALLAFSGSGVVVGQPSAREARRLELDRRLRHAESPEGKQEAREAACHSGTLDLQAPPAWTVQRINWNDIVWDIHDRSTTFEIEDEARTAYTDRQRLVRYLSNQQGSKNISVKPFSYSGQKGMVGSCHVYIPAHTYTSEIKQTVFRKGLNDNGNPTDLKPDGERVVGTRENYVPTLDIEVVFGALPGLNGTERRFTLVSDKLSRAEAMSVFQKSLSYVSLRDTVLAQPERKPFPK